MNHKIFIKVIIIGLIIMTNFSYLFAYDPQISYFFEDQRSYNPDNPDDPVNSDWYWDCDTAWFNMSGDPLFSIPRWGTVGIAPPGQPPYMDSVFVDDDRVCIVRAEDELGNPVTNATISGVPTVDIYVKQIILGYFDKGTPDMGGGTLCLDPGEYTIRLWGGLTTQEHYNNVWQYGGTIKAQVRLGNMQPEYGGPFPHGSSWTTYELYEGTLMTTCEAEVNGSLVVGNSSPGEGLLCDAEFNMSGGKIITNQIALANRDCNGVFNMTGGTITFQDFATPTNPTDLKIPSDPCANEAVFNLGDVNTTGTLNGTYTNIIVGPNVGTFNGWGTVSFGGTLSNSGIVAANGYGTKRDLDFSSMSSVQGPNDNIIGYANGWYALNKGRLVLPSIAVTSGLNTYNWGEDAADTDIDMINSARITFNSSAAGTLTGNLLCDGSLGMPENSYRVIGAWNFQNTASVTNAGLVFRYDDLLSDELGTTETDLKIYQYQINQWVDITSSIDTAKKQITGSADSLGVFIVGAVITTPANCAEVHKIGQGYPGDLNFDCEVDFEDLSIFVEQWLINFDAKDFSELAQDWRLNNNPVNE